MLERCEATSDTNAFEEAATRCESGELLGRRVAVTVDPDGCAVLPEQMIEHERVDGADRVRFRFEKRHPRVQSRE